MAKRTSSKTSMSDGSLLSPPSEAALRCEYTGRRPCLSNLADPTTTKSLSRVGGGKRVSPPTLLQRSGQISVVPRLTPIQMKLPGNWTPPVSSTRTKALAAKARPWVPYGSLLDSLTRLKQIIQRSWLLLGDHRSRTVVYFLWSADAFRLAKSRECAPSLP